MSEGILPKVEANILVIGAEKVGKSESIYNHNMKMAGQKASFSIWDSACPQMTPLQSSLNEKQLRWADGFVVVYSICDRASFAFARHRLHWIRRSERRKKRAGRIPVILVGNKRDLQHQQAVSREEGQLLALSTDSGSFEISTAETHHGSLVVFHELLNLVQDSRSFTKKAVGIREMVRSVSALFGCPSLLPSHSTEAAHDKKHFQTAQERPPERHFRGKRERAVLPLIGSTRSNRATQTRAGRAAADCHESASERIH